MWELLSPGYGLLYKHVYMIGGVTRRGGLSGLKAETVIICLIEQTSLKEILIFIFLTLDRTWNKNREFFGNTELFLLAHAYFSQWERGACEERAGKRQRTNFDRSFFTYWYIFFFYWILLEKRFYVVWISFSCAQPILIAWTSYLKLVISKIIYCGYFCRSNHFEWENT